MPVGKHICAHCQTHTHSLTHARTHARTRAREHAHTHTHTHTHTTIHTYTRTIAIITIVILSFTVSYIPSNCVSFSYLFSLVDIYSDIQPVFEKSHLSPPTPVDLRDVSTYVVQVLHTLLGLQRACLLFMRQKVTVFRTRLCCHSDTSIFSFCT